MYEALASVVRLPMLDRPCRPEFNAVLNISLLASNETTASGSGKASDLRPFKP